MILQESKGFVKGFFAFFKNIFSYLNGVLEFNLRIPFKHDDLKKLFLTKVPNL